MGNIFKIEKVSVVNSKALNDINELLKQHEPELEEITFDHIDKIINSSTTIIFIAKNKEGKIIGIITLVIYPKLIGLNKAWIEDLVVHENYRRQGIGEKLVKHILEFAKNKGVRVVCLTSQSKRIAANALYQKLGFVKKETNYYRYEFRSP